MGSRCSRKCEFLPFHKKGRDHGLYDIYIYPIFILDIEHGYVLHIFFIICIFF